MSESKGVLRCDECGAVFEKPRSLSRHQRAHKRRYQCEACPSAFSRRDNREKHVRLFHGSDASSQASSSATSDRVSIPSLSPIQRETASLIPPAPVVSPPPPPLLPPSFNVPLTMSDAVRQPEFAAFIANMAVAITDAAARRKTETFPVPSRTSDMSTSPLYNDVSSPSSEDESSNPSLRAQLASAKLELCRGDEERAALKTLLVQRDADVAAAERRCSEMDQRLTVAQRECTLSERAAQSYKTRTEDLERQLAESERKLTSLCQILTSDVQELQPRCGAAANENRARFFRDLPSIPSLPSIPTKPPPALRFRPPLSPPPASRELTSIRSPAIGTPVHPSTTWTLVLDRSKPDTQPSQSTITVSSSSVTASLSFSTDTPRVSSSSKRPRSPSPSKKAEDSSGTESEGKSPRHTPFTEYRR